jgi:hypothetical protein
MSAWFAHSVIAFAHIRVCVPTLDRWPLVSARRERWWPRWAALRAALEPSRKVSIGTG